LQVDLRLVDTDKSFDVTSPARSDYDR
jgi:hypothetical protein